MSIGGVRGVGSTNAPRLGRFGLVAEQRLVQIERFVVEFFDADRTGGHLVEIFDDQIELGCRRCTLRGRTRCARRDFLERSDSYVRRSNRFGRRLRHRVHQLFFR